MRALIAGDDSPGTSWITLYPDWYRREVRWITRRAPDFLLSAKSLALGRLAFAGELVIDCGSEKHHYPVVLVYPPDTPYRFPSITPIQKLPQGVDWMPEELTRKDNVRWMPPGWQRHQMADGSLCLIEADRRIDFDPTQLSSEAVLDRARQVFRALAIGRDGYPFPDTIQAELEEHYPALAEDILIGEAFYAPSTSTVGVFYAIPTFDTWPLIPSFVVQEQPERSLFLGVHIAGHGANGGKIATEWRTEQSGELQAAFPFVANTKLAFECVVGERKSPFQKASISGAWFTLPTEPPPFRSVRALEDYLKDQTGVADPIANVLSSAGSMEELGETVYVGLRYPDREQQNECDWLFLAIRTHEGIPSDVPMPEREGARRDVLRAGALTAIRRHELRRRSLEVRNGTDAISVAGKHVVLLGTGALGGDIAEILCKAGVGTITLVDCERMRSGNVIRHSAGLAATGLFKVDAVKARILQHNPFVVVNAVAASATASIGFLEQLLRSADLAVSTIADDNTEHVVNEAAVRVGKTVIYGRALRRGKAARVFRVRPMVDACKACLALHRRDAIESAASACDNVLVQRLAEGPASKDGWIDIPEAVGEVVGRECGSPVLAGSAADLRLVAALTARAVLDEMQGASAGESSSGILWNSLIWSLEPIPELAARGFAEPYSIRRSMVSPRSECPVCSRPRIGRVVLAESAKQRLLELACSKPDRETGGALIGFETPDHVAVIVEVTDAGPRAIEEPSRFLYDADHINDRLQEAYSKLEERGQYLGEWHTHLEAVPYPSARDAESLSAIAEEPQYLTDEPIMLIGGVQSGPVRVERIHASCWPNGRAMRIIEEVETLPDGDVAKLQPS
ncbi:MAG: ThiF family adenylyltransferase [Gemmatimonadales bacterium]